MKKIFRVILVCILFSTPLLSQYIGDAYRLSTNQVSIPLNSKGIIGDVLADGSSFGQIDGKVFLYSSGFFLSGINDQKTMWANGMASSSQVLDYIAGKTDKPETAGIYRLRSIDEPFSESWQEWKHAVANGAYFYDGDGNGKYYPVDKNNNQKWDSDEDAPDILGDETVWCVYNDGLPSSQRTFTEVNPQGIEIRQTMWEYATSGDFGHIVFIRYSILNTGTVSQIHDSVYFGIWADPDLGDFSDDLLGSDTTLNAGYAYNDGSDAQFGSDPPCFLTSILQGPWKFTGNRQDTAYNRKGKLIGTTISFGSVNLGLTSFIQNMYGNPTTNNPEDHLETRNYLMGLNSLGESFDPCNWDQGTVLGGMVCSKINNKFMYSGNPVKMNGWVNSSSTDQLQISNTGPFRLEMGKPIDIIVAYSVGRSSSAYSAIDYVKEIASRGKKFFESYFSPTIVSVDDENQNNIIADYSLKQNYPNPFNPSTRINYSIPTVETRHASSLQKNVVIKVYDILGKEIATLVNEQKSAGNYSVEFNGENLPSGIYLIRLQAGNFSKTIKASLIK